MTDEEVVEEFGVIPVERIEPNGAIILKYGHRWGRDNILKVFIPQLKGVKTYGEPSRDEMSGFLWGHKKVLPRFHAAFKEIEELNLLSLVIFWGGGLNPRLIRGSKTRLSRHCWDAFDLNPQQNPLGGEPAKEGEIGCLLPLIPIFEKHGFINGGGFTGRPDWMHFETGIEV